MHPQGLPSFIVRHRMLLLMLLGALLYVSFLGLRDVWYPDEPDIAEVARAMFLSGDWIHPRRMGEIWVDYPPMIYWIGTISSHLLGDMTAFSLRLPNGVAAIGTVTLVCWAASRWFDATTGLWAGLSLMTFLLFVYEGNSYRPDVTFTLTIAAGMILYAEGVGGRHDVWLRAAAFAFFGLAMLAKGPLGLLLPGLVLVLWHGARLEWRPILVLAPLSLIALAVYLPWFVATAEGMGWESMAHEFYAQNFERFLTSEHRGHAQPWYYFLRNFWLNFLPWSWLFPAAVIWLFRTGHHRDRKVQLALWWFGAFFVFLSIAATKRELYLLPAYPAVALCLAPWLAAVVSRDEEVAATGRGPVRIYTTLLAVAYSALAIGLWIVLARLGTIVAERDFNEQELEVAHTLPGSLLILGATLFLSALWLGHAAWKQDTRAAIVRITAVHVAIYVVILGFVMPEFAPTKTYAPQSRWITETIGDETHFGMVDPSGTLRRGGFSFYTGTAVPLLESRAEVDEFFDAHPRSIVLVAAGSADEIFAGHEEEWHARVLRDIRVGRHLYRAVRGPEPE